RWQFLAGPWLAAIPFLFKETGAFLIAPMALLLYDRQNRSKLWLVSGFVVYALAVLGMVYLSDWSAGRPALVPTLVFDNRFTTMHTDAVAQQLISSPTLSDWLNALPAKVWESGWRVVGTTAAAPFSFLVISTLGLFGIAAAAAIGAVRWKDN